MYVHMLYIYIYICTHQGAYLLQSKAFLFQALNIKPQRLDRAKQPRNLTPKRPDDTCDGSLDRRQPGFWMQWFQGRCCLGLSVMHSYPCSFMESIGTRSIRREVEFPQFVPGRAAHWLDCRGLPAPLNLWAQNLAQKKSRAPCFAAVDTCQSDEL